MLLPILPCPPLPAWQPHRWSLHRVMCPPHGQPGPAQMLDVGGHPGVPLRPGSEPHGRLSFAAHVQHNFKTELLCHSVPMNCLGKC